MIRRIKAARSYLSFFLPSPPLWAMIDCLEDKTEGRLTKLFCAVLCLYTTFCTQSYAQSSHQFLQLNQVPVGLGLVCVRAFFLTGASLFVTGLILLWFCVLYLVAVWLSVLVQSIAWKDSTSPKQPIHVKLSANSFAHASPARSWRRYNLQVLFPITTASKTLRSTI